MQSVHANYKPLTPTKELVLLCDGVNGPANLGSIFRTSDAFGVLKIYSNRSIPIDSARFRKTARNTQTRLSFQENFDLLIAIDALKSKGYLVIALEITKSSIPIAQSRALLNHKIALLVGDENHGISDDVLARADEIVHLPMFGQNSSMNVAQATAIALFQIATHE